MPKLSRAENQSKWFEIIKSYEQSELSKDQFCSERYIKKTTLDYWIRKSRVPDKLDVVAVPGFAGLIPKHQEVDEIRLRFEGIDIFVSIHTNPHLLRTLIQGLAQ